VAKDLTKAFLDNLRPGATRREVFDGHTRGLVFILQPSGATSWAVRYRIAGKNRKLTVGSYPAIDLKTARELARKALAKIAAGGDPAAEKQTANAEAREPALDLIETVVETYVARYAKKQTRERSWKETERLLKREVVSAWRGRSIAAIRRKDVVALLDPISDRAPIVANRVLAALSKMFGWAVERGLIEINPCVGVRRPSKETSRERTLDDDEIRSLWAATSAIDYPFGPLVRMLVLTGARLREAGEARCSEVDLAAKTWTIPRERAKNDVEHQIPLSPQLVAILESLPRFEGYDFVFTLDGRRPFSGYTREKRRLDAQMTPATPFVLHDLRRSFASGLAGLGVAPHVIEAALNHRSGTVSGIARIYNRFDYAGEKRAALERWAAHVEALASGVAAENVVVFSKAKG
jgi:integrase